MTDLRVESLSKRFGGLRVFQDISFDLPAGGLLGVIGPNGAGKTTLINVISGRQPATAGRVILDGRDITNQPAYAVSRLGLARSFQQTNTFKSVSVGENIARAIRFGSRGAPPGLASMLTDFGLMSRQNEIADKLPYGLQKILGLVMSFATSPRILLLDEPAAGLERNERQIVDSFVQRVRQAGASVLIVEHDMDLIRRLCPRILVLDAGALLADGPPAEVLARPDVIAAYLGEEAA
ncbi:MAG: ABC transporter ATP-binding protein [Acetobacteraceae bacterium]|nr:ABC transporter ATP-binding protein [Pseudomonadota bacterium]